MPTPMQPPMQIQVQKLRLQRGWSQQQLAELSGLSTRTIQRIENGHTASTESLKSLASVFEIDFSTLSSEPPTMSPETQTVSLNAAALTADPSCGDTHASTSIQERLALLRVRKIRRFYIHLLQFVAVILGLTVINLVTNPQKLWVIWPALGWGIGLVAHGISAFEWMPFLGPQWERKQVEKHLGRRL